MTRGGGRELGDLLSDEFLHFVRLDDVLESYLRVFPLEGLHELLILEESGGREEERGGDLQHF